MGSNRKVCGWVIMAGVLLLSGSGYASVTVTQKCEQAKLKALGKVHSCLEKSAAGVIAGKPDVSADCLTGFAAALAKIDAKASSESTFCRYIDNGDGTVSDLNTGLVWEQKTGDGSVHDASNAYTWSVTVPNPNGTAFTDFLYALNGGTSPDGVATSGCFAGHCDWRLPAIEELSGIRDLTFSPAIDSIFGPVGPIAPSTYWSITTFSGGLTYGVWVVSFADGSVGGTRKDAPFTYYAHAVRGGL